MTDRTFIGNITWICPRCDNVVCEVWRDRDTLILKCPCGWESKPMEVQ